VDVDAVEHQVLALEEGILLDIGLGGMRRSVRGFYEMLERWEEEIVQHTAVGMRPKAV
jgi:hypothetical protein